MIAACSPTESNQTAEASENNSGTEAVASPEKSEPKPEEASAEIEAPTEEKVHTIDGKPMQNYLEDPSILQVAKDYYTGRYEISDEPKTHSMVNELNHCGEAHRPFYLAVFNKIVGEADETVSGALGAPAKEFVGKDPNTFSSFAVNSTDEYTAAKSKWVELVGFEFLMEDDPKSALNAYKKRLEKVCDTCSDKQKAALQAFVSQLDAYVAANGV